MTFLFQSLLLIGLPLVALPLLIHLINLRRHRRVEWAAMDFLLESQKRNKNWILLRQLLLLLLRTAAIAAVVFMLAGPMLESSWGSLLGRGRTHHIVLLDDSYSMADRWDQTTAWDEGRRAVSQVLQQALAQSASQNLTLLRFSEAAEHSAGRDIEYSDQPLDREMLDDVETSLGKMDVAQVEAGPIEAFQAALGLPEPTADETRVVYVVSDFREPQWSGDAETRQLLDQLEDEVSHLHLIQCVEETRPNLAITRLEPESGLRSAGVETWFQLGVTNYGDTPAAGVTASIRQDGQDLPAVHFDEITPGSEVTRRFRVAFGAAGHHELEARLPSDALPVDNVRYFAGAIPVSFPVLIIDGSRGGDDAFYLRTALSPAGLAKQGWSPRVEPASYLRKPGVLDEFAAVFLLDVPRLDETEVEALESYVAAGGGVGWFLGPQVQQPFYNEHLYRDGAGLFPVPLDVPTQLLSGSSESVGDVEVADHPVFRVFSGQRNSFLAVASVNFYYAVAAPWRDDAADTTVLARLRNDAPFVVEKRFGEGRVVVQLCKLSPQSTVQGVWSTWSVNPVFPVVANELAGYLTASQRDYVTQEVGERVGLWFDQAGYEPEVGVLPPGAESEPYTVTPQTDGEHFVVDAGRGRTSGVWQFQLQTADDQQERRLLAVNVPVGAEGDLNHLDRDRLANHLEGVNYTYSLARQLTASDEQLAGFLLADALLYFLIFALVAEQWLAYKASYHS